MGGGGGGQVQSPTKPVERSPVKEKEKKKKKKEEDKGELKTRKGMKVQKSDLEEEMKNIKYTKLSAEKQRMIDEMNEEIKIFDKDIGPYVGGSFLRKPLY